MDAVERTEWEGRPVTAWRDLWGVPTLRVFERIGSTSQLARGLAEDGAAAGTTILAEEQTRGRGRRGRVWHSPPGASLALSMVLRPPGRAASRLLTLRLGLAAARAVEDEVGAAVQLKWPNDLIVGGRKAGGILCESIAVGSAVAYVVAGIGLNLRRPDDDWPDDVAERAIALDAVTDRPIAAAPIAGAIIRRWLDVERSPGERLAADEMVEYRRRDALMGRMIQVEGRDAGTAEGITREGALRVRREGRETEVLAGTVRAAEPPQGETE